MSVVEDRVCVKYEIGYKSQEMEKVDLKQYFDDGTKKSHKVPKFTGKEGAEGLVYVYKSFKKAAEHLSFDEGDELFMNWEFCLSSTAEESWKTLMDLLEDEEKTPELFEECYQTFLLQYCTADARDILIDYLKTSSCKKPHDADVRAHSERIRSLCVLANYLPGTMPEINDAMRKKMLVDTFPADWQVAFHSTKEIANVTEQQIVSFMCLQKTAADSKERKRSFEGRGGGPPAQRGRFGGRGPGRGFGMNGKGFGGRGFNNGGRFGNFLAMADITTTTTATSRDSMAEMVLMAVVISMEDDSTITAMADVSRVVFRILMVAERHRAERPWVENPLRDSIRII